MKTNKVNFNITIETNFNKKLHNYAIKTIKNFFKEIDELENIKVKKMVVTNE